MTLVVLDGITFTSGDKYAVVIYIDGGGPGKFDQSDNYFSIVDAGLGLKDIKNQLASISEAASQLMEKAKKLLGR